MSTPASFYPRGQHRGRPGYPPRGRNPRYRHYTNTGNPTILPETIPNGGYYIERPRGGQRWARIGHTGRGRGRPNPQWTPEQRKSYEQEKKEEEAAKFQENKAKWENYIVKRAAATGTAAEEEPEMIPLEQWKKEKDASLYANSDPGHWNPGRDLDADREERLRKYIEQQAEKEKGNAKPEEERISLEEYQTNALATREALGLDTVKEESEEESDEEKGGDKKGRKMYCPDWECPVPHGVITVPGCGMFYREDGYNYDSPAEACEAFPNLYLTKEFIQNLPQEPSSSRDVATFMLRERDDGFSQYDTVGNMMMDVVDRALSEFETVEDWEKAPSLEIIFPPGKGLPKLRQRDAASFLRPILINGLSINKDRSNQDEVRMYRLIETLLEMLLTGHKAQIILPYILEFTVDDQGVLKKLMNLGLVQCLEEREIDDTDIDDTEIEDTGKVKIDLLNKIQQKADETGAAIIQSVKDEIDSLYYGSAEDDAMEEELRRGNQLNLKDQIRLILELIHFINLDQEKFLHPVQMLLRFVYKKDLFKEELEDFLYNSPPFPSPTNDNELIEFYNLLGIHCSVVADN